MPFVVSAVTAVAGAISATLAAGGIGAALLRIGGTLLLSTAAQALMPKPQTTMQPRTVTIREPVVPRDLVYGRTRKGGVIVFLHSSGSDNKYLDLVIVLAAHQVQSIGAIYFEGDMALNADGVSQGRWAGKVLVEKKLGVADQTAFAGLQADLPDKWTEDHRLRGCAAIRLRLTYDQDAFPGGIPNITVDLEGKDDIWDPRTQTAGYSENPALCLADYMGNPTWGIGARIGEPDGIDAMSLVEAANICDETVALAGGGSEPRYACNGVITLSEVPKTIIEGMLSSFAGRCAFSAGSWRIHAGAWRASDVALTADHIREGGLTLATRVTMSSNFNGVRGQFVSPENDWQPDDFPAYASDVYLAEDGGEQKWRDISLPFTISAAMAQRLAKIELERARRQMTVRLSGKLSAWAATVGDVVTLPYARWGFAAKPFEVHGVSLDLTASGDGALLLPELVLRETSPLVYDWSANEEQIYAAAPRTALPNAYDIPAPGAPQVTEDLYVTRDGGGLKVLAKISWEAAPSGFVAAYQLQAKPAVGADWIDYGRTDGTTLEIRDIAPGNWAFRVKAISVLGVSSPWQETQAEILGLTAPPAQLENVTLQTAGGLAILKWSRSVDPDVRVGGNIVIRHSKEATATWADSYSMDRVSGGEAIAVVPLKPGTYLVRAEDSGGRAGPETRVTTKGAQVLAFSALDFLQADPGFVGSKTNLQVTGSNLTLATAAANGVTQVTAMEGEYAFATGLDLGAVKRVRLRSEIGVAALALNDRIDARTALMDTWADFDGSDGAEIDVLFEIRETDDDPAGTPAWSPWGRLDNHEIEARAVEARAHLTTKDASYTPIVSQLRLYADEVA
ncbi:phage tail protein [Thalassobacter stenotrophicus]|uniref:phage tail protein n=1 Tax=Thalassobacter stenotrophicus TaxID=266809 RepID=UPI0022A9F590|nr:phage tail protein [Thalassobacter stenotrophicus]UYP67478.1 phage tail protein [Thalassobacter stenotrophicus]